MPPPSSTGFVSPVSPERRRIITAALLVGTFLSSLEVLVVGPAMPDVVGELGNAGLYPWVFTAYVVAQTVTIPAYGWLADRWGRRNTYLLSVVMFVAGSLVCATATSMPWVIAGRAVQGLGAGGLVPLTVTIFGDLYPVDQRTRMQGIFSLIWGVSSLLGPLAGGALTEAFSWRSIFWINILPGAVAAAVVLSSLPGHVGRDADPHSSRGSARQLLRDPTQQAVLISGLVLGGVLLGVIGYLPVQVQAIEGGSALDAGLALIPMSLAWTLAANLAGRLLGPLDFRGLTRLGMALVMVGAIICALQPVHWAGLLLLGLGFGFTISTWNVAVQEAAPLHLRGTATSWSLFVRSIGGAVAVPLFAALAGIEAGASSFDAIPDLDVGLARVFQAIAVAATVATAVAWARFPRLDAAPSGPGLLSSGKPEAPDP